MRAKKLSVSIRVHPCASVAQGRFSAVCQEPDLPRLKVLGCLLLVAGTLAAQGPVRLRNRDLNVAGPARPARITRGGHYIIGFAQYPDMEVRAGLARRGIRVLQYVPDSALMVSVPSPASLEGLNLTFATPMETADKLTPQLADTPTNAYLITFHSDTARDRAR